jgi:hypothetical protein
VFDATTVKSASDLPRGRPVVIETAGELRLVEQRPFGYAVCWLREVASGAIEGDLGLAVEAAGEVSMALAVTGSYRQKISLDKRGWLRLRVYKRRAQGPGAATRLSVSARAATRVKKKPHALAPVIPGLWNAVYRETAAALEKKCGAEVSYCYASAAENTALVDCSFSFAKKGLRAYRRALKGDYAWLSSVSARHVEIHRGVLTHKLPSEARLELHLPFLHRMERTTGLATLAPMEVTSDEDGRLLVYQVDGPHRAACKNSYQSVLALAGGLLAGRIDSSPSFTLTYSDRRRIPGARAPAELAPVLRACGFEPGAAEWLSQVPAAGAGDLDVSFALSIPGSLASAWLDSPGEGDPLFFPAYARVSVAVQRSLRAWLPYVYFASLERYETPATAFPLVVYEASRPFAGRPKYDFNYEVMSDRSMAWFFRLAARQLPEELARIEALLLAAGKPQTAALYSPRHARNILASVRRRPRLLHSLLVADAFFFNALVKLGCRGRELRERSARNPGAAGKGLSRIADRFVKKCQGKLRGLHGGQAFPAFGSLLLVTATSALSGIAGGPGGIQAVLRISRGEKGLPDSLEQTLVNAAYRLPAG